MPNHVRNIVKMEGIADLPYFTEVDGHRCFDFNKLVAMPKDLQIEDDTLTDERIMYFITERCQIPLSGLTSEKTALLRAIFPRMYKTKLPEDIFQRVSSRLMTATEEVKERVYEYGRRYVSNIEKYGAPTWYLWCIRHWGTKWNAGYTEITIAIPSSSIRRGQILLPSCRSLGSCIRPSGSNTGGRTRTLVKTPGTVSCSMAMSTWSVSPGIKKLWTFMRSVGVNAMTSTLTKMEKCSTATQMTEPAAMENDI